MVGPRSTGCRTCVTKRVKCDERRPACSRCGKSKLTCPGYNKRLQWTEPETINPGFASSRASSTTSSVVGDRSRLNRSIVSDRSRSNTSISNDSSPTTPYTVLSADGCYIESTLHNAKTTRQEQLEPCSMDLPVVPYSPSPYTDDVYCNYFMDRYFSLGGVDSDFQQNRLWFWTAIQSPLTSPVSNVACRALIHGFYSNTQRSTQHRKQAIILYTEALGAMQTGMRRRIDLDLMCAVSLLQMYEACQYTGPRAWQKHSVAMWHMFITLGPNYFKERPARSLFLFMRSQIIIEAIIARRRCFLESPEWQTIIPEDYGLPKLEDIVLYLPGMMEDSAALVQSRDPVEAARIFNFILVFLGEMSGWWNGWSQVQSNMPVRIPVECVRVEGMRAPPPMPGESEPTVLLFHDVIEAASYALYHAYLIMTYRWVNRLLEIAIPGFAPDLSVLPVDMEQNSTGTFRVAQAVLEAHALSIVEALYSGALPHSRALGAIPLMLPAKQAWMVLPEDSPHALWVEDLMAFIGDNSGFEMSKYILKDHAVRPGMTIKESARVM